MIDLFALVVAHGLLALAAWRLAMRGDLDEVPGSRRKRHRADESKPHESGQA